MNRDGYLSSLERALGNISPNAKAEIMYDYREHFEIGLEQGETEDEICNTLGDPRVIAKQYRAEYMVKQADSKSSTGNVLRAIFAALSLGFFNLIFMLPIFGVCVALLVSLYACSISLVLSGIGIFLATLLAPMLPQWINLPPINSAILIFSSISVTSFGLLFSLGTLKLTKLSYRLTISYIKTNLKIIGKQERESENYV